MSPWERSMAAGSMLKASGPAFIIQQQHLWRGSIMKGSQLQAQSPRRALLWSGRIGPFTSSCPKVFSYQKTTQRNTRAKFTSFFWSGTERRRKKTTTKKTLLPFCITLRWMCNFIVLPSMIVTKVGTHCDFESCIKFSLQITSAQLQGKRSKAASQTAPRMPSSHIHSSILRQLSATI